MSDDDAAHASEESLGRHGNAHVKAEGVPSQRQHQQQQQQQRQQQRQRQRAEFHTALVGNGTAGSSTTSVSERLAVLRLRDAGAASTPFATQPASADRGLLSAAENGSPDCAGDWRAKLMEAMVHEQQQCSEHDRANDTAVDVTDEGWLPT